MALVEHLQQRHGYTHLEEEGMAGSQFPESMEGLARMNIAGLQARIGDAAAEFVVAEKRDAPTPWLTLECTVFDYLPLPR
jgi:hypothetical protein